MSHSFSVSYVKEMEHYLDLNINILTEKIASFSSRHEVFDLKRVLHYYTIDVLGELAFSQSFGVQISDNESLVPPVIEHSLLAAVTGAWPARTQLLKIWLAKNPFGRTTGLISRSSSMCGVGVSVRTKKDDGSAERQRWSYGVGTEKRHSHEFNLS